MIQPQSAQFQLLSANNLLNRGNRNCTAMVQPKNNVGSNNTMHMSQISTLGAEHLSQQSRNMLPDQSSASAATMVAQYNSCKNNQTASMSHSAKHYKSTNQKEQHKSQSSSSKTEIAQAAGLQAVRDGATAAQYKSGINETKSKLNRASGTQGNRSETIYKNNSGKVGLIDAGLAGPGHNNSQTSLKSQRSGSRGVGTQQHLSKAQHVAGGSNCAISPANRSAANAKEQSFFQHQSFSSHGQRETDQQSRAGVAVQGRATGLSTGSSEKYLAKLQVSSNSSTAVPHQIIVNGFHHKPSTAIMSSQVTSQAHGSSGRASQTTSSARPKSNSGSGTQLKGTGHESTGSKGKNATSSQIQAVMGLMISGGTQSSLSGTDSQVKGANNSRKKHTQSTTSKMSHYTTDQKGKTVRNHDSQTHHLHHASGNATPAPQSTGGHSSSHGSALNSMRNYSGSLQKAPMAGSTTIYKSQRGHQYSKISTRGSKPVGQEHVLHNAKTMKALGVSGTVASESTGLSRSGRSGEGDRTGGANHASGAVHSSFSASGIPRHPKLMHQKHSGAIANTHNASGRLVLPNQKSQGGGSLTQNQTPNHLIHSNSHKNLSKQRQFYNSNQHQQTAPDPNPHHPQTAALNSSSQLENSICHIGGSGSTTQYDGHDTQGTNNLPSGMPIHSSSDHATSKRSREQHLFNNNQKIQRFDFRDYDSEEKLRIKPAAAGAPEPTHSNFDRAFDTNIELRVPRGTVPGDRKDSAARESAASTAEAVEASRGRGSGRASDSNRNSTKGGQASQRRDSLQQEFTNSVSAGFEQNSQRLLSQSKSTGKVTTSEKATELTQNSNISNPLGQTVQIDDGKMKHFQQMIQNVKFHSNEMRVVQERSGEFVEDGLIKKGVTTLEAARAYDYAGASSNQKQQQFKSLQIQIPVEGGDERGDGEKDRKDSSLKVPGESERKDRSEGGQTSHSLQCGEENLLPSTEKKGANSKISAQRIPKSGGAVGLMKTSTHLITNMQANKNIFLGKMPCNSTRNNSRYSQQILDDEFQLLFQKDKSSGRRRQEKANNEAATTNPADNSADQNQETPKILYRERASVTNRILPEKVSYEKRRSPEKTSTRTKGKKRESSSKKDLASSGKKQSALRSTLLQRGTSQGPPITKNRENRIAAEDLVPAVSGSTTKIIPAHAKGQSVTRVNGSTGTQPSALANQSATLPSNTLSKCIGIRSGSESNVKTNSSNIWNAATTAAGGLGNMEKISYDQRGLGLQPAHKIIIPNDDPTKTSSKRTGIVRAYAANTNQGLVRNYNEDRVSIITNLLPPKSRTDIAADKWPRCSYFGIYDGHGGSLCADFLRDNLHQYVILEPCFPANPKEAIVRGFEKAEKAFMDKIYNPQTKELKDKSGSCAIVVLIVQEICYVANVGDSRAVLSCEGGQKVYPLSLDHKPGEDTETKRIRAAGGQIYYRTTKNEVVQYDENKVDKVQQMTLAGPLRVLPGRLSVARTFGDPEAKITELGGNPHVVIHNPEVKSFQIKKDHDFIVLGCDGIFDKMSNGDSVMCVWKAAHDNKYHQNVKGQAQDVHKLCGMGVEYILKNSLLRRSLDNVTVVVIGFSNLKHEVFGHQPAGLNFKSDGDSGTDNQLRAQSSQIGTSTQQLKQSKKQNIVANSHRDRDSKTNTQGQDKQESGKTLERNRSANLPRGSCAGQGISMKYQQIASTNRKSQETTSKGSRKHSAVGHSPALVVQEGSDRSSKKRALTSSSSGGQKEKKQSPTASSTAEAAVNQSLQIKKEYHNLHGNVSTGQLHKAHVSYTARPSHSGQTQKEGAKPPLSSQITSAKHNMIQNQFGSQSTTPTNSLQTKVSSSHLIGNMQINPQKHGLKAPRQSNGNQAYNE